MLSHKTLRSHYANNHKSKNLKKQSDFKKTLADKKDDYLDSLSEGKDVREQLLEEGFVPHDTDDYGSKVDTLVDSMSVTDEKESTTHRRRDLDSL